MNPEIIFPKDWEWPEIHDWLDSRHLADWPCRGWWYSWHGQVIWVLR